jgi:hypothetical protein
MPAIRIPPLHWSRTARCPVCQVGIDKFEEDSKNQVVVCSRCKTEMIFDAEYGLLPSGGKAGTERIFRQIKLLACAMVVYLVSPQAYAAEDLLPPLLWYLILAFLAMLFHGMLYAAVAMTYVEFLPRTVREDLPSANMEVLKTHLPVAVFWFLIFVSLVYR